MSLVILAPFGDQHAVAVTASAAAVALLIAGLLQGAKVIPLVDSARTAHGSATARSSSRDVVVLPQRDPDAAGKPRPRAPGSHPSTV
jgi:hypothetical protein